MNQERLQKIKESIKDYQDEAEKILEGEHDNYDGADGARYILEICRYFDEIIDFVETKNL